MSDSQLRHELQDLYHDLLDRVKFMFERGIDRGSDLVAAIDKELEIVAHHSQQELAETQTVLKDDLRELGQQAAEVQQGIREIIELDRQYLSDEIRQKLRDMMDHYTLDMMALNEQLAQHQRRGKD